jgi:23S rRNA (uracil1939-C5)-methyltransferase
VVELRVDKIVTGGDGMARGSDGKVVFVPGALPDEVVRVEIVDAKRDFSRAAVLEIVEPSPHRVEPPCPYVAARCGGCGWQHIDSDEQRRLRRDIVIEALARLGGITGADVAIAPPSTVAGFRTTVRMGVRADGRAAYRAARSNDLVAVDDCLVAHPLVTSMLSARFPGAQEVVLRAGARTGDRMAWPTADESGDRRRRGNARPNPAGAPIGLPDGVRVGPDAHVEEVVGDQRLRIGAGSFFQSSPEAAEGIARAVVGLGGDELAHARRVVDAYGGVGLLGALAVPAGAHLTSVELSPSACADARRNLVDRDAIVVESTVERWRPPPDPVDAVLADPSRTGLGREAVDVLCAIAAPTLVLVSCDAGALGRDAALLAERGYAFRRAEMVDAFPHTPHVEVVSRFERKVE